MRRALLGAAAAASFLLPVALIAAHEQPTHHAALSVVSYDRSLRPTISRSFSRFDLPDPTTTTTAPQRPVAPRVTYQSSRVITAAAAPSQPVYSCEQRWYSAVANPEFHWPVQTMLRIMCHQESGGDPLAVNPGRSGLQYFYANGPACGLMQLKPCPGQQAADGNWNLSYAYHEKYVPACGRGDCLGPWGW